MLAEADLPDDPALLRAMLVAARGEIAQQQALIADLEGAGAWTGAALHARQP